MERLKDWYLGLSKETKRFFWVRVFYITIGILVSRLIFIDQQEKVLVQQERDSYRDSLVVEKYRTQVFTQILINDAKQDEKDSNSLRTYNVDSLISAISALQVVTRSGN